MADLEARHTWWPRKDHDLVERIYFYAEGMLALKELEYYGAIRHGAIKERIAALRAFLLERIEDRRLGKRSTERRAGPRQGAAPGLSRRPGRAGVTAEEADALRRDLNDLFVVVQLYSYPGDYVKECPTLERVAETLMKFEEDIFASSDMVSPRGPRRARVRLGPAIDVGAALKAAARPRHAAAALTDELERQMQALLDALGPGRPMPIRGPAERMRPQPAPAPAPAVSSTLGCLRLAGAPVPPDLDRPEPGTGRYHWRTVRSSSGKNGFTFPGPQTTRMSVFCSSIATYSSASSDRPSRGGCSRPRRGRGSGGRRGH